ncbi:MAG: hypothetical protein KC438_15110, partial [Thermomicrobiales bacterium]|nr:hypothetical protein [Thermomicrobiales bacterium]
LKDYTRRRLRDEFDSLDAFLRRWSETDRKSAIVEALAEEGVLLDVLEEVAGKDLDPFDLICHVAFDRPPLTRRERAENVRKRDVFARYGPEARTVLDALLDKYAEDGVLDVDDVKVLDLNPLRSMGTKVELIRRFGGKDGFLAATNALQAALYEEAVS